MYSFFKKAAKTLVPQKWLFHNELFFRKISSFGYVAKNGKHACNICGSSLKKFVELETGDLLCPICGSLPRNRRLWYLLENHQRPKGRVLDFSPSRCLYRAMKKQKSIEYVSSDWAGEFMAEKQYDLTAIDETSESFDFIICYHVLEHIEADEKAMGELFRVLKKGGTALIQTPFKEGEVFEDYSIQSPSERLKYFGQEDHVRIYSVNGLAERLSKTGFHVDIQNYSTDEDESSVRFGFKPKETILICKK